ncbi:MAG TPA: GGDEF domain-containing protein [bacterium]|nr:GGDEF domain-containing protein [bacterium]HPS29104.1 GGDEF domain-containing protein [bacterium]
MAGKRNEETQKSTQIIDLTKRTDLDFSGDRFILLEIYGANMGKRRDIDDDSIVIGRGDDCNIIVNDPSVSRNHMKIFKIDKVFYAEDLGSTNRTYVNEDEISGIQRLENGDRIKIGNTIFKFISSQDMEAEYYDQLYQFSIKDGLTGLYNRKSFDDKLESEFSRCKRYGHSLSLVMFDIDHFKNVNDTYGHLAGDAVLTNLSKLFGKYFRSVDFIARYGGEEFTVILPETPINGALLTTERIRLAVSQNEIYINQHTIKITISAGLAEYNHSYTSPAALIDAADKKLYEAKNNGRNRVEM